MGKAAGRGRGETDTPAATQHIGRNVIIFTLVMLALVLVKMVSDGVEVAWSKLEVGLK